MTQDTSTYYVWIGGSCDYGHKERAGGAAVVIELMEQREQSQTCLNSAESRQKKTKGQHNGNIISRDVISDLHTTEFRMMLTLMLKVMQEIPENSPRKTLPPRPRLCSHPTCQDRMKQTGSTPAH